MYPTPYQPPKPTSAYITPVPQRREYLDMATPTHRSPGIKCLHLSTCQEECHVSVACARSSSRQANSLTGSYPPIDVKRTSRQIPTRRVSTPHEAPIPPPAPPARQAQGSFSSLPYRPRPKLQHLTRRHSAPEMLTTPPKEKLWTSSGLLHPRVSCRRLKRRAAGSI